jgi:ATP-dependent Lon protease
MRCSDAVRTDEGLRKGLDVHIHFPAGGIPKDGPSSRGRYSQFYAALHISFAVSHSKHICRAARK